MEKGRPPVRHEHTGRLRVLGLVRLFHLGIGTVGIRLATTVDRLADDGALRRDDGDAYATERNCVASLHDRASASSDGEVRFVAVLDATILLPPWVHLTVIE